MSKNSGLNKKEPLADDAARRAIVERLEQTMMVEAGAGSGKTTCLVKRMTALIGEGKADIRNLAAVTFTRKAAAELRQRFQLSLEREYINASAGAKRDRIGKALEDLEQGFIGTIHSFCARLLRERPVEAGIDPEFVEIEEIDDSLIRNQVWEAYVAKLLYEDKKVLPLLYDFDLTLDQLKGAFETLVLYPEVAAVKAEIPMPDRSAALPVIRGFLDGVKKLMPDTEPEKGWDPVQSAVRDLERMLRVLDPKEVRDFFRIITPLEGAKTVTQKKWKSREIAKEAEAMLSDLSAQYIQPILTQWKQYRHYHIIRLIEPAAKLCSDRRNELSKLNFQDLLMKASDLLRDNPEVRQYFRGRITHLLVDEFQDTDPIQAEVMLYLTGTDIKEKNWRRLKPAHGSLFVVGDPKQSIYRFRRADIDTYNLVRGIISKAGGEFVELRSNFRSVDSIGGWLNPIFKNMFPEKSSEYQAGFSELNTLRPEKPEFLSGVRKIITQKVAYNAAAQIVENDSLRIASWIKYALEGGVKLERTEEEKKQGLTEKPVPSDFLILLAAKKMIPTYARRLEEFGIPFEVAGGNALKNTYGLSEVLKVLRVVSDPDSAIDLVSVLRGLFFGISDDMLYRFKQAGGRFSIFSTIPPEAPPDVVESMGRTFERLRTYREWTRTLAPSVAVEKIMEDVGLIPYLMNADMGGSRTGNIMKVLEYLQQSDLSGASDIASVAEDLGELIANGDMDEIDINHGSQSAVRIMNLHKAKGLEAPVVFLANPTGKNEYPPELHIRRDDSGAFGYFTVSVPAGEYQSKVVAVPPEWDKYFLEESMYAEAEKDRLIYVAGTRAKNLLIVSSYSENKGKSPWTLFDPYLSEIAELDAPSVTVSPSESFSLRKKEFEEAGKVISTRIKKFREPGYSVETVTSLAKDDGSLPVWKKTGRGMSWGKVIHRVLEAVNKGVKRQELEVLVSNVLIEEGRTLAEKDIVLKLIDDICETEFWKEVLAAKEKFVEVPFSLRLSPAELDPEYLSGKSVGDYVLLTGTIDLIYKTQDGWTIVDYKTDEVGSNIQSFVKYYGPQVRAYSKFWAEITGEKVTKAGLFFVKTKEFIAVQL